MLDLYPLELWNSGAMEKFNTPLLPHSNLSRRSLAKMDTPSNIGDFLILETVSTKLCLINKPIKGNVAKCRKGIKTGRGGILLK